jgi:titin
MANFFRRTPISIGPRSRSNSPKRFRPWLEVLEGRLLPSVFPVTSTADPIGLPGSLTLRQAILDANANPGSDTISFAIPGLGVHIIQPVSALPTITDSVLIDGTTQTGYAGKPLIQLDGSFAGSGTNGLTISASGCTVRGLDITRFNRAGVGVLGSNNIIQANYIGTDATGTSSRGNGYDGVEIAGGAKSNLVGTNGDGVNDAAERNLISGNGFSGVAILGIGTNLNVVAGNLIGTDVTGGVSIPNRAPGVFIFRDAQFNRIGTDGNGVADAAERNIISGNALNGVLISDLGTNQNVVAGNFIGTNAAGTAARPNGLNGVQILGGAQSNRIGVNGGDQNPSAEGNVISGNSQDGVQITDIGTNLNIVAGDFIGTDRTGTAALPNGNDGVYIANGARSNRVGTNGDGVGDAAEGNLISGNLGIAGVRINNPGSNGNVIAGNFIGTNASGTAVLGNAHEGVIISKGAQGNVIGVNSADKNPTAERNVISGNGLDGVWISSAGTNQNVVAGNFIGIDLTGNKAVGNGGAGVLVNGGAQGNRIGTNGDGVADGAERNIISGNGTSGVYITDSGSNQNVVAGNFIGTDVSGSVAVSNGGQGIAIVNGAQGNRIGVNGGDKNPAAERNLISGNLADGVSIRDAGTINNVVAGNLIGTNGVGTAALANGIRGGNGVFIHGGASHNLIGTNADGVGDAFERNIISGNIWSGVRVSDLGTGQNTIAGNFIGTDKTGALALPNLGDGILMYGGTQNNPVGRPAAANVIAFNGAAGVKILDAFTTGDALRANSIFSNADLGIDLGGNGVTPNDSHGHIGPNDYQNFPILSQAVSSGLVTAVTGTLKSVPMQSFAIDFYASPSADPSGFGQGKRFIGSFSVMTDGSGNASFSATLSVGGLAGQFISATATAANGDTSEFCKDVIAKPGPASTSRTAGSFLAPPLAGSSQFTDAGTSTAAPYSSVNSGAAPPPPGVHTESPGQDSDFAGSGAPVSSDLGGARALTMLHPHHWRNITVLAHLVEEQEQA